VVVLGSLEYRPEAQIKDELSKVESQNFLDQVLAKP
jgi:hypothetical protein